MSGYSTISRSRILSVLHRTLVTYDPSKSQVEQNLEQYHAMYFIGTLINLTAAKGFKSEEEGRWKQKVWVRDSILAELVHPTNEEMEVSTISEGNNNYSLGASTISSKHSSSNKIKKLGSKLSQTISALSSLLQNISVLLEEYMSSNSPNALDRLVETYVHLIGIPRENLLEVNNAFTFSVRPSKTNPATLLKQLNKKSNPIGNERHYKENEKNSKRSYEIDLRQEASSDYEDNIDNDEITVLTMEVRIS